MNKKVEQYQSSMELVKEMFEQKIIDESDYKKAESYLASKYGINAKSIYRLNNLICTPERVINIVKGEDLENDGIHEDRAKKEVSKIT